MNGRRAMTYGMIVALAVAGAGGAAGAAHAQEGGPIPAWIKSIFEFYVDGQITDGELISALEFLIAQDIIHVSSVAEPDSDRADAAAAERAEAAIERAAELAEAAADSLAVAARAEDARDRATSPSAIRENNARADAAAREAAEAAEAAAEAIAEAAEAAEAAAESIREAGMDPAVADSRARIAATIRTAADSLARTGELAVEAKKHAEYIGVFRTNSPSADRQIVNAISDATSTAAEGARAAYQMAARATYAASIESTSDWPAEAAAEAAEAAERAGAAGASEDVVDEARAAAQKAERARCETEAAAEAAGRDAAEAEAAAGHFVSATTELTALAKDVIDGDASMSTIASIWTSINIGVDALNSIQTASQARGLAVTAECL